jgi:hypothetical protein
MGTPLIGGPAAPIERRVSERVELASLSGLVHLRLPPGRQAVLLNVSREGASIEAASRLLPGGHVEVHISTQGWKWRGRAIVKRCRVSALVADHGARYLAALQFEAPLEPGGTTALVEAARGVFAAGNTLPEGGTGLNGQRVVATREQGVLAAADANRSGIPAK